MACAAGASIRDPQATGEMRREARASGTSTVLIGRRQIYRQ